MAVTPFTQKITHPLLCPSAISLLVVSLVKTTSSRTRNQKKLPSRTEPRQPYHFRIIAKPMEQLEQALEAIYNPATPNSVRSQGKPPTHSSQIPAKSNPTQPHPPSTAQQVCEQFTQAGPHVYVQYPLPFTPSSPSLPAPCRACSATQR